MSRAEIGVKMQKNVSVTFLFIMTITLVSCLPTDTMPVKTETQIPSHTPTPAPTLLPTLEKIALTSNVVTISTLESFPTPISIFDYPGQVSDNGLLLTVLQEDACYQAGEAIRLNFIISNLSDESVKLIDQFALARNRFGAGGNIVAFLTTIKGEDLFTEWDWKIIDIFDLPPNSYVTILSGQDFMFSLDYNFPRMLSKSESFENGEMSAPITGLYMLRFVYMSSYGKANTWTGVLASNQIGICIVD